MPESTQVCRRCLHEKPLSDFSRRSKSPNGHDTECRDCARDRMRAYRATEAGRLSARAASERYHASERGRDVHRAANRAWYLRHKAMSLPGI
jgi:superfamily II helicase